MYNMLGMFVSMRFKERQSGAQLAVSADGDDAVDQVGQHLHLLVHSTTMRMRMSKRLPLLVDDAHILLVVVCGVVALSITHNSRNHVVHIVSPREVLLLAVFGNTQQLILDGPVGG